MEVYTYATAGRAGCTQPKQPQYTAEADKLYAGVATIEGHVLSCIQCKQDPPKPSQFAGEEASCDAATGQRPDGCNLDEARLLWYVPAWVCMAQRVLVKHCGEEPPPPCPFANVHLHEQSHACLQLTAISPLLRCI